MKSLHARCASPPRLTPSKSVTNACPAPSNLSIFAGTPLRLSSASNSSTCTSRQPITVLQYVRTGTFSSSDGVKYYHSTNAAPYELFALDNKALTTMLGSLPLLRMPDVRKIRQRYESMTVIYCPNIPKDLKDPYLSRSTRKFYRQQRRRSRRPPSQTR